MRKADITFCVNKKPSLLRNTDGFSIFAMSMNLIEAIFPGCVVKCDPVFQSPGVFRIFRPFLAHFPAWVV